MASFLHQVLTSDFHYPERVQVKLFVVVLIFCWYGIFVAEVYYFLYFVRDVRWPILLQQNILFFS